LTEESGGIERAGPSLKGQTVILVDDGIATGATFFASLGALLKAETARIVAAVPVAPPRILTQLKNLVDETVVLHASEWFFGIGQFYEEFLQLEDHEVIACLEGARVALSPVLLIKSPHAPSQELCSVRMDLPNHGQLSHGWSSYLKRFALS